MQNGIGQHLLENLFPEDSPVHHKTQHPLWGPFHHLTATLDHVEKALAQIGKVIGRFKVKWLSAHRVDKVAVHRFIRPTDRGTPPFQHVLFSGVVLGVRVKVELALRLRANLLGIEAGQRLDIGLSRDPFQFLALRMRKAHHLSHQS